MQNRAWFSTRAFTPFLICVISFALAACAAQQTPPAAGAQDEALYQSRLKSVMVDHKEPYDPLDAVPGAADVKPLPTASHIKIAAKALKQAIAYAAANRSKALLVWQNGALVESDYFGGATVDTPLAAKSLAKPLTTVAIGRAIALGDIKSLDQPVSDFIAEWRGTPKAAITIRTLLDMRSGLQGQIYTKDTTELLNRAYLDPHHDHILIDSYPLTHAPGTRFDYSNANAELIAIVIERATGQRYAQFVSQQVLQPLGAAGGSVWIDRPGGMAHSGCCILLPAETWMRLAILLLDDGVWNGQRLLPEGYVDAMRHGTPQNPHYGLGLYVAAPYTERRAFGNADAPGPRVLQSAPFLASDVFMFDGNADQVAYIIPSERLIILRMGDAPPQTPEWDNAVLVNTILGGIARRASGSLPQPRS